MSQSPTLASSPTVPDDGLILVRRCTGEVDRLALRDGPARQAQHFTSHLHDGRAVAVPIRPPPDVGAVFPTQSLRTVGRIDEVSRPRNGRQSLARSYLVTWPEQSAEIEDPAVPQLQLLNDMSDDDDEQYLASPNSARSFWGQALRSRTQTWGSAISKRLPRLGALQAALRKARASKGEDPQKARKTGNRARRLARAAKKIAARLGKRD